MQLRKILAELSEIFERRAAPAVDRLIVVADRRERRALAGQQFHQFVLARVGVLILVDQQIAQLVLPAVAHLLVLLEEFGGQTDQVVEIDRLIRMQRRHVITVDDRGLMFVLVRGDRDRLLGHDHAVLPQRDDRLDLADEALVRRADLLLDHAEAVVRIHDRELRLQTNVFRFLPQNLHAERVEGADRQLVDGHFAAFLAGRGERLAFEQLADALAHFQRGLVRERDGGDVARLEAFGFDQVGDFLRDHARLAAACAGEHETRTVKITDRFILSGVQACGHRLWMGNAVEGAWVRNRETEGPGACCAGRAAGTGNSRSSEGVPARCVPVREERC